MLVALVAGSSVLGAALVIVIYHFTVVRRRLLAIEPVVAQARAALEGEPSGDPVALGAFVKRSEERLTELERVCRDLVFRVGFVRYNSLPDVGSDLSYAIALLNTQGDGVVLTSIFSREETRTFGKSVRRFAAEQDASDEEQLAIELARTGRIHSFAR